MNKKAIVESAVEKLRNINRRNITNAANNRRFAMLKQCGIKVRKLSKSQIQEIDLIFKKYNVPYTYATHELVYSVTGNFDPKIIPEDLYRVYIDPKLCDYNIKYFLSDKNYFDVFMPSLHFPKTIVKNVRGSFYNDEFKLISREEARMLIKKHEKVVVKPSNDSGFGRGVELIETNKTDILTERQSDYIVQEVLKQHKSFSVLNESSVNIVRVVTLFINDKPRVVTAAMRIGGVGDFTDNVEHKDGSGMIVVGIDNNGKLKKYGYHSNGSKEIATPGGITFEGVEVFNFDKMKKIAIREHQRFPQVRFIGWDFTLNSEGDVVVMEYNTKSPGVLYYQYTNGPLFGDSTDELLNWLSSH